MQRVRGSLAKWQAGKGAQQADWSQDSLGYFKNCNTKSILV